IFLPSTEIVVRITSTVSDIGGIMDGGIIDVLRTVNPHVRVLVAQVIASASTCHTGIPALNASLPALVADKDRPESPLTLVDQYSGFDPSTMTYDGTHPNAAGDARMADRWFEKLTPVRFALPTEAERVGLEPTVLVAQTGRIRAYGPGCPERTHVWGFP